MFCKKIVCSVTRKDKKGDRDQKRERGKGTSWKFINWIFYYYILVTGGQLCNFILFIAFKFFNIMKFGARPCKFQALNCTV